MGLVVASVCPGIYGHEMVKAGLILGLFGGSQADGGALRSLSSSVRPYVFLRRLTLPLFFWTRPAPCCFLLEPHASVGPRCVCMVGTFTGCNVMPGLCGAPPRRSLWNAQRPARASCWGPRPGEEPGTVRRGPRAGPEAGARPFCPHSRLCVLASTGRGMGMHQGNGGCRKWGSGPLVLSLPPSWFTPAIPCASYCKPWPMSHPEGSTCAVTPLPRPDSRWYAPCRCLEGFLFVKTGVHRCLVSSRLLLAACGLRAPAMLRPRPRRPW
jgi:hypothetical protein